MNLFQHNLIPHVKFYKNYYTNNIRMYPKFSAFDIILNFGVKLNLRSGETAFIAKKYICCLLLKSVVYRKHLVGNSFPTKGVNNIF